MVNKLYKTCYYARNIIFAMEELSHMEGRWDICEFLNLRKMENILMRGGKRLSKRKRKITRKIKIEAVIIDAYRGYDEEIGDNEWQRVRHSELIWGVKRTSSYNLRPTSVSTVFTLLGHVLGHCMQER